MKVFYTCLFSFLFSISHAQLCDSLINRSGSILKKLQTGDSVLYYQCHVEEVGVQLATASGQTLSSSPHKCSVTEKFVIIKGNTGFGVKYYSSSLTDLPNRKFSGLKIREKPYWNFKLQREFTLTETQVALLLGLERKGREAIEYDFVISKNNTNQVIIKMKKDFKQLVIEGDYVISKLLK